MQSNIITAVVLLLAALAAFTGRPQTQLLMFAPRGLTLGYEPFGVLKLSFVDRGGHVLDLSGTDAVLLCHLPPCADGAGHSGEHFRGVLVREPIGIPALDPQTYVAVRRVVTVVDPLRGRWGA